MAFGIEDLERDINRFKKDIEEAKTKYIEEYTEYVNITTDFENVEQKYDFLQQEVGPFEKIFPEEQKSNVANAATGVFFVSGVFEIVAGVSFISKKYKTWRLSKALAKAGFADKVKAGKVSQATMTALSSGKILRASKLSKASVLAKQSKISRASKIAKFTSRVGFVLAIVGIALEITSVVKRKQYLKDSKKELQEHLAILNGFIDEANDETRNVIDAFSMYFQELEVDIEGIFNESRDGFLGEDGQLKFDNPETGAISQLRGLLNGAIRAIGELNASITLANRRMDRYISRGLQGPALIEEVVFDTELPEALIQRLYVFKLRELGSTVQEVIALSELPEDLVKALYARGYLDDGKSVEETVTLSELTEAQVRRIFASKLLDDELNAENPDDVLDLKVIAEKTGLSEDIVREIRTEKLADLLIPDGDEEDAALQ